MKTVHHNQLGERGLQDVLLPQTSTGLQTRDKRESGSRTNPKRRSARRRSRPRGRGMILHPCLPNPSQRRPRAPGAARGSGSEREKGGRRKLSKGADATIPRLPLRRRGSQWPGGQGVGRKRSRRNTRGRATLRVMTPPHRPQTEPERRAAGVERRTEMWLTESEGKNKAREGRGRRPPRLGGAVEGGVNIPPRTPRRLHRLLPFPMDARKRGNAR